MRAGNILLFTILFSNLCVGQTFFEFYEKGLEHANNDSLNAALSCFEKALKIQETDNKQTRTYGVKFIEYFPNRELGIVYYKKKNLDFAIDYLEKSMNAEPSERAKDYLLLIGQVKHDRSIAVVDDKAPDIEILSPAMLNSKVFQPVANNINLITIVGKAKDPGGVFEVIVNDKQASMSVEGDFTTKVFLGVGQNEIFMKATDLKQNSITKSYLIYRDDTIISEITSLTQAGKYYALIIGISDYTDPLIMDLDGFPLQDAKRLAQILNDKYTFEKETIQILLNPDRSAIQRALDNLSKTITEKDNLLIFYAGHGHYDEQSELGYWLPADAEKEYTSNWIYNDVLVANLKRIRSKHSLLISDACFSGSIFKTRSMLEDAPVALQKKYELKSRKAITSGVLQTVPNKSVFFKYLADQLENNQDKYLSASQLFQDIEIPVGNNSPNTPQFGVIRNVGDEGGDFIFILNKTP